MSPPAGLVSTKELKEFIARHADVGAGSTPEQLMKTWNDSPVGQERLGGQLRSKRFDMLATQAAAVGATVLDDGIKWAPARWVLKPLSWPFRVAHFITFRLRRSD
jgi:hypothetical protein